MKYTRIRYPDGQISVKVTDTKPPYRIEERVNSYEDLFFIKSISDVMGNVDLFIPCLFGQRSDRRFVKEQSFDLKIICDFINSCNFRSVEILDPHSDVSLALINNSYKSNPIEYVRKAILSSTITNKCKINEDVILVSPDAGAYKKVFEYGEEFNLPVVAAVKHRDLLGKIDLKFIGDVKDKDCLIVDDICDGGYTFIKLSEILKAQGAKRVFLYITHAYFSKGFDELKKNIDHIFCTNSVKDIEDSFITQYKVI